MNIINNYINNLYNYLLYWEKCEHKWLLKPLI